MKRLFAFVIALTLVLSVVAPATPTSAEPEDWDITGGHFYTQTGGSDGKGYTVTDADGIRFWSEFKRLGGVAVLGYPISMRFQWYGYTCQAFQRVILQWRPEGNAVAFANVFDIMHQRGLDDWLLQVRQTPRPLEPEFDAGLAWDAIVVKRLALMEEYPPIKTAYNAVKGNPVDVFGLPTSKVTDMGNNLTLRCQRAVFQLWKIDVPWAKAGQVTVALGGDISKESKLFASTDPVVAPEPPPPPTPTGVPASPSVYGPVNVQGLVVAVGDSVMLGAATALEQTFANINVDAAVSRHAGEAISIVAAKKSAGAIGSKLVIHFGNNGPLTAAEVEEMLSQVADVPTVLVLTIKEDRYWQDANNALLAAGVAGHPNAVLVDWYSYSVGHPEYFWDDGIHLAPTGGYAYANLVASYLSGR